MYKEQVKVVSVGNSVYVRINRNGLSVEKGDLVTVSYDKGKMIVEKGAKK